jgi:iron complex outermembrane receptor protein
MGVMMCTYGKRLLAFGLFFLSSFLLFSRSPFQRVPSSVSLKGVVRDAASGKPLAGASVFLNELKTGVVTNDSGYFQLINLPGGKHLVEISFIGYASHVEYIHFTHSQERNFALQPSILEVNEVVVTGVSVATEIRRTPIPVTLIKRPELMRRSVTNLVDLIAHEPGISQVTTGPAIAKPVIRGLGFNRVIVLNDGVRQEGQQWGDEHGLEIDEYSVQKLEIVKGPASLMYGSDAMAGVLQVITHVPVPQGKLRGMAMSQYQSNNRLRGSSFQLGSFHKNGFNWNGYASFKAAADYRNRYDGPVYNSRFREFNSGGYIGLNKAWGYSHFIFSRFNQKAGVVEGERNSLGQFIKSIGGGSSVPATESDFLSVTPQIPWQHIRHTRLVSDNSFNVAGGRITVNAAWQRNVRQEFGNADDPEERSLHFDLNTVTFSSIYHFGSAVRWQSSIGISGMRQENRNRGVELLIPAYRSSDAGAFFHTRKTKGKFTFSGGLRVDARGIHSEGYAENNEVKFTAFNRSFSNLSGSIGFTYQPVSEWVFKWNFSRGFRAPTIAELASNGAHEGTNRYEYGVSDLRSETSWQTDIAAEWSSDHVSIAANLFYNTIQRFIFFQKLVSWNGGDSLVEVDGSPLMAFTFNQRNARLYGAEVKVDLHPHPLDWLHFENSFSYVRGRFAEALEGNSNIPFIPAARLLSQVRADVKTRAARMRNAYIRAELEKTFAQDHAFTSYNTETPTPGYALLHAGFGADITSRGNTLFNVHFSVLNITDVAYQQHLSRLKYTAENMVTGRMGVFNMGRNFTVRVNVPIDRNL